MEKLVEAQIEIDKKMVSAGLPSTMVLYALDSDHFVISSVRSRALAEKAPVSQRVHVTESGGRYIVHLPKKIYEFYRLEENDYSTMVSEKDPIKILVSI